MFLDQIRLKICDGDDYISRPSQNQLPYILDRILPFALIERRAYNEKSVHHIKNPIDLVT